MNTRWLDRLDSLSERANTTYEGDPRGITVAVSYLRSGQWGLAIVVGDASATVDDLPAAIGRAATEIRLAGARPAGAGPAERARRLEEMSGRYAPLPSRQAGIAALGRPATFLERRSYAQLAVNFAVPEERLWAAAVHRAQLLDRVRRGARPSVDEIANNAATLRRILDGTPPSPAPGRHVS